MELLPNTTYRFVFDEPFSALGWQTGSTNQGFYTVLASMSFERLLELKIDLITELYSPASLTETDYENHRASYAGVIFYRLQDANDPTSIICVPTTIITQVPRSDIGSYGNLVLGVNCGPLADATVIAEAEQVIADVLEYLQGLNVTVRHAVKTSTWMLESEYEALVTSREAVKTAAALPGVLGDDETSLPFNMLGENASLRATVASLRTKISALEEIVTTLNGGS